MALVSPDLALDEKPPFTWGSSQWLCQDIIIKISSYLWCTFI